MVATYNFGSVYRDAAIYTIAIKLSIFLYDPDFQSNEK